MQGPSIFRVSNSVILRSSSVLSISSVFSASPGSEAMKMAFIDCTTYKEIISSVYGVPDACIAMYS